MAAASRIDPKLYFSDAEWARLNDRSWWKGVALVAHAWIVIGLAMAAGVVWPVLIPLVVMVVGARQLGLAILMHDAAHGALHRDAKVNDILGGVFCMGNLPAYRPYHLKHHRFAQQAEDPDLILSAPFPVTPGSFRRKVWRDLSGRTFLKQRFGGVAARLRKRAKGEAAWPIVWAEIRRQRRSLIWNGAFFLAFASADLWWAWLLMWLVPMATWLPLVTRLRNIAEHALVAQGEPDPLRQARTTHANWIERALIAPYWVNFHCEHHMFMYLPCWTLPRANRMLVGKGVAPEMLSARGYASVLREAAAAA